MSARSDYGASVAFPRRFGAWIALLTFGLNAVLPTPLLAQGTAFDVDAPAIEHQARDEPSDGARQVFSAIITDDDSVASVLLFHRLPDETEFASTAMRRIGESDVYEAVVEVDVETDRTIEYYIEAQDPAGNSVLRGFVFDPLTRVVAEPPVQPASESVPESEPIVVSEPEQTEVPTSRSEPSPEVVDPVDTEESATPTWWYVAGALALGALAAAASSGGDSDGGGGDAMVDDDPSGCCRVELVFDEP